MSLRIKGPNNHHRHSGSSTGSASGGHYAVLHYLNLTVTATKKLGTKLRIILLMGLSK